MSNIVCFLKILRLRKIYYDFLNRKNTKITTYKRDVINLFKKAGINDLYMPAAQNAGYGLIATFTSSAFTNFPSLLQDNVSAILTMFDEAIGVYRGRIFETFNPLYWVNCIIFLPKNIFQYLGVGSEKIITKIFQIAWWFLAPISLIFRDKLTTVIKHLLASIN
jgi:hypothetical protein